MGRFLLVKADEAPNLKRVCADFAAREKKSKTQCCVIELDLEYPKKGILVSLPFVVN
jgi:hypothetical protein